MEGGLRPRNRPVTAPNAGRIVSRKLAQRAARARPSLTKELPIAGECEISGSCSSGMSGGSMQQDLSL